MLRPKTQIIKNGQKNNQSEMEPDTSAARQANCRERLLPSSSKDPT